MSRFNLIYEPWIYVLADDEGTNKLVSLEELFNNAHKFKGLAGETQTQNFAVLRILLAILHTVFSRFDANGEPYSYILLDSKWKQVKKIDEDDNDDYTDDLYTTWEDLWIKGNFPNIIIDYLSRWEDRFFLLDEEYPFFQVRKEDLAEEKINKKNPSLIKGKNINRMISESGNKKALFSPKSGKKNNKEILDPDELARWLITFQSYTGLSDKVIFGQDKYKASKGWLFDIGGIYLQGDNLFETLLLNLVLVHPEEDFIGNIEKPCWEYNTIENIESYFPEKIPYNLSELYTVWSRAIYIDPNTDFSKAFAFEVVKLPDLDHTSALEPMTIWRFNESGENKNNFTPRKHQSERQLWQSFGLIAMLDDENEKHRRPSVIKWLGKNRDFLQNKRIQLTAISMQDDGNATSWVPTNEIFDSLNINEVILTDIDKNHWVPRINDAIEETKRTVEHVYGNFIREIADIRRVDPSKRNNFVRQYVIELYFLINQPFRWWLSSIEPSEDKDNKITEWRKILRKIVLDTTKDILKQSGYKDYIGIIDDKGYTKNIATAYNNFSYKLNNILKVN